MLVYKAMYKFLDDGVHAEVLDFPGVISWGPDLNQTRQLLSSALVDMAELNLERREPLPQADPAATDPDSDLEEPIYLLLQATSRVTLVPQDALS
jgi:predicted RNase H-like HicB family nuclease